jgi:hypothetical protein
MKALSFKTIESILEEVGLPYGILVSRGSIKVSFIESDLLESLTFTGRIASIRTKGIKAMAFKTKPIFPRQLPVMSAVAVVENLYKIFGKIQVRRGYPPNESCLEGKLDNLIAENVINFFPHLILIKEKIEKHMDPQTLVDSILGVSE